MLLNAEKAVVMNTSLSSRMTYDDNIFSNGTVLSHVDHAKLLGVVIDNKLSFNQHIEFSVAQDTRSECCWTKDILLK